jgi:transposase
MHAIGIDMSKRSFHAAFDESTVYPFLNSESGIDSFIEALTNRGISSSDTTIGIEATGAYHLMFCAHLTKQQWRVHVINPLETHHMIQAQSLRRVKTDTKDALAIRKMAALGFGYLYMETDATIALKALVVERNGLVEMRSTMKHRLEAHKAKQEASTAVLHDSYSELLCVLQKEIRSIEKEFVNYAPETQQLLRSIPGIGILSAAALVAYIVDIKRFASPEKLVAYIGLDSRVHESGTSVHGKGYISKRGNTYLRHLLFNAAFIARQHNPTLKTYFEKKIGEGKHYFSAMCAVERKLIHLMWAVWTRGTPFEEKPPKRDS